MSSSNEIDPTRGNGAAPDNARRPPNPDLDDLVDKYLAATARGEEVDVNQFVSAELPPLVAPNQRVELRRRLLASQSLMDLARAQKDRCGESSASRFPNGSRNGEHHQVPRWVGRYEVHKVLATGRISIVYQAYDPKFDRDVALKVTRSDQPLSTEHVQRWRRDARAVAQFRHPNIVPFHEAGEAEAGTYIDMGLVRGTSLQETLHAAPEHRLEPREVARIVRKIADALQYAHARGVIHRDVKPSNILIDDKGEPQLIDFGLARRLSGEKTLTRTGQVLGTPAYLSPEQARGQSHAVSPRADVFSLGVVMYQMLTGQLPFDDAEGSEFELLGRIVNAAPTPPSKVNPSTPRDLEMICLQALEKEPCDRFASAGEMADDLSRWLDDVPIRCRRIGPMERTRRWCTRNPVIASLSAAFVLSLVVGIAATWIYAHKALVRERESQFRLYVADMHLAQEYIQNDFVGGRPTGEVSPRHRAGPVPWLGVALPLAAMPPRIAPIRGARRSGPLRRIQPRRPHDRSGR